MPYFLQLAEDKVLEEGQFKDEKGATECVTFVRTAAGAPETAKWTRGVQVFGAKHGDIKRGTAIATFDSKKNYPTDELGKHAAIYLSHDKTCMRVLDQWKDQGKVKERPIWFNRPNGTRRSNDGNAFYVIELKS